MADCRTGSPLLPGRHFESHVEAVLCSARPLLWTTSGLESAARSGSVPCVEAAEGARGCVGPWWSMADWLTGGPLLAGRDFASDFEAVSCFAIPGSWTTSELQSAKRSGRVPCRKLPGSYSKCQGHPFCVNSACANQPTKHRKTPGSRRIVRGILGRRFII